MSQSSTGAGVFQDLTVIDVSGSVATSYAAKRCADHVAELARLDIIGTKPKLPIRAA